MVLLWRVLCPVLLRNELDEVEWSRPIDGTIGPGLSYRLNRISFGGHKEKRHCSPSRRSPHVSYTHEEVVAFVEARLRNPFEWTFGARACGMLGVDDGGPRAAIHG